MNFHTNLYTDKKEKRELGQLWHHKVLSDNIITN